MANDRETAGAVDLRGRRCLVVGLASTGVSVARFLKRRGAVVVGTDQKALDGLLGAKELMAEGVKIIAGGHDGALDARPEIIVVSPGVPRDHGLLKAGREYGARIISDIELAYWFTDCPVIAVAGTNGKSTTTTLIGAILEAAGKRVFTGGNLGTPAIECAGAIIDENERLDAAVWEVSSFHLETTVRFNPHIGVLLNITEDHLDRYRDFDDYAAVKFRLFENQGAGDWAVLNMNDPVIAAYVKKGFFRGKGRVIGFSVDGRLEQGLYLRGDEIVYAAQGMPEEIYPARDFSLTGLHNMENIMAAIAVTRIYGIESGAILKTLAGFKGLAHRMEFVRRVRGVTYIDDSKGTNVGSLVMALRGIKTPVVLIAGGRDKGGDYGVLKNLVKDKVKAMILIGEARFRIKESLGALTDTVIVDSMSEAVKTASLKAIDGDTVLLCPACSSFDMFKSYKERGEVFRALVESLGDSGAD